MLVVVTSSDGVVGIDRDVASFVASHRKPWLTTFLEIVIWLGSAWVLVPVAVGCAVTLRHARGSWRPLLVLAATLAGANALSEIVKRAVARTRPDDRLVHAVGYAFPSGHATFATAGWLCVAILLGAVWPARRTLLVATAVAVIAVVGASRIYLNVHWATDVLGGWALGGLWLAIVLGVVGPAARVRETSFPGGIRREPRPSGREPLQRPPFGGRT